MDDFNKEKHSNKVEFIFTEIIPRFIGYFVISFCFFIFVTFLDFVILFVMNMIFDPKDNSSNYFFILGCFTANIIFFNFFLKKKIKEIMKYFPIKEEEYDLKSFRDVLLYNDFGYGIEKNVWYDCNEKGKRKDNCSLKVKINRKGISDFAEIYNGSTENKENLVGTYKDYTELHKAIRSFNMELSKKEIFDVFKEEAKIFFKEKRKNL